MIVVALFVTPILYCREDRHSDSSASDLYNGNERHAGQARASAGLAYEKEFTGIHCRSPRQEHILHLLLRLDLLDIRCLVSSQFQLVKAVCLCMRTYIAPSNGFYIWHSSEVYALSIVTAFEAANDPYIDLHICPKKRN